MKPRLHIFVFPLVTSPVILGRVDTLYVGLDPTSTVYKKNSHVFIHFLCKFSHICNFAISVQNFIIFSPKCRTKKLGMQHIILGRFCSFLNWEGPNIRPQIMPRKIPGHSLFSVSWITPEIRRKICSKNKTHAKQ